MYTAGYCRSGKFGVADAERHDGEDGTPVKSIGAKSEAIFESWGLHDGHPGESSGDNMAQRREFLQNGAGRSTQGGYLLGVSEGKLLEGKEAKWSPLWWRSYKLRTTMSSTLAAECHALTGGLGCFELALCTWLEMTDSKFTLERREYYYNKVRTVAMTDAKLVFDHIKADSPITGIADKRAAVNFIIARESIKRMSPIFTWLPGVFQLANMLTKEDADAMDKYRSVLSRQKYRLEDEQAMLRMKAQAKLERQEKGRLRAEAALEKTREAKEKTQDKNNEGTAGGHPV